MNRFFRNALMHSAVVSIICTSVAWAGTANSNAPWETALETITNSLSGPVAKFIGIAMMVLAGAALLRGTEFQTWVYSLLVGGIAVVTMGNATSTMTLLGVTGCLMI